jgi:hypothetical protein
LLIGSSHAHWTRSTLLRCKISDFFRSLLEVISIKRTEFRVGRADHGK